MRAIAVAVLTIVTAVVAQAAPFAYIPNAGDNTVSVIDTATDTVVTTIPIPGPQPRTAAVSPDGMRVYVGDLGGVSGKIHVIDARTNSVVTSVPVFSGIFQLAISPDGAYVYGAGGASVKVVSTATDQLVPPLISAPGTPNPLAVAFHPSLPVAYAVGATFQSAMAIDTITRTVTASIGTGSTSVAVHPGGAVGYTLLACSGCFPPPGIDQFDTATNLPIPASFVTTTGDQPHVIEVDPTGAVVYVSTHDSILGALLSKLDPVSRTELAVAPVGSEIWGLDLHPDGSRLYVADRGGNAVRVVDPVTLAVTNTISVGLQPFAQGEFIGPIASCGDATVTFPEECDDGNTASGDCCSSTCQAESGDPCDDGDACTTGDACDANGDCVGSTPVDCDDTNLCTRDTCDSGLGCLHDDTPFDTCRQAGKSILLVKNDASDDKDKLLWKWLKGEAVALPELGDPTQDTAYALCLHAGTAAALVGDYHLASGSAWTANAKGFKYKDATGGADGVQTALLKSGTAGKAKALAKGKGAALADFDLTALVAPVVAQLVSSGTETTGICLNATYELGDILRGDDRQFKAKAQN